MQEVHLICNAHIDPVWLWHWEEGAGEALSTFRVAADLCEEYDGLVFNHNEALLYRWVEEYEPALFTRIQRLVREGKWHIMGGWYLQPDCNLPSGEGFVRQVLLGLHYFQEKFGVRPRTAINFDAFGHTRGLVQILTQAGYRGYIHTRPSLKEFPVPEEYRWVGFDGSSLLVHREDSYQTLRGKAVEKVREWMARHPEKPRGMLLWGVGNHGGGPSRVDLDRIGALQREVMDRRILHSTPEAFFEGLDATALEEVAVSLRPCFVGCYTSQVRIKQWYRALESQTWLVEKMLSHAALAGVMPYPRAELDTVYHDLMLAQFHDIIAGTSIQTAEEKAIQLMHHGLETLDRLRLRAFFALAAGSTPAAEGETPIFVYNPHPFPVRRIVDVEVILPNFDFDAVYIRPEITRDGKPVPHQPEHEASHVPFEFRKRVLFLAKLEPGQMNRYSCTFHHEPEPRPEPALHAEGGFITVSTERLHVAINTSTGLVDRYAVDGVDYFEAGAFLPVVMQDIDDAWGSDITRFLDYEGAFRLMTPEEARAFSPISRRLLPAVRVVEDGPVRAVIEALFIYGASSICQTYHIPKEGAELHVSCRVYWNEKRRMLKLNVPTPFAESSYRGQTAYGVEALPNNGDEAVAQQWVAVVGGEHALTCINAGSNGSDCARGLLRLSLLRSPGFSAHRWEDRVVMPQDRFCPRIDQGERLFQYWFQGGPTAARLAAVDREALVHNEQPFPLPWFPPGPAQAIPPLAYLSDEVVQLSTFKQAERSEDFILRVFEPTGEARETTLRIPALDVEQRISLRGHEFKTYRLSLDTGQLRETDLLEGLW